MHPWHSADEIRSELDSVIKEFCQHLKDENLTFTDKAPFTQVILSAFRQAGEKRQFTVRHKWWGGEHLWDLCWLSGEQLSGLSVLVPPELNLVLESEMGSGHHAFLREEVLKDFIKIVHARAFVKVMVFVFEEDKSPKAPWDDLKGCMEKLARAQKLRLEPVEIYLLIGLPYNIPGKLVAPLIRTHIFSPSD